MRHRLHGCILCILLLSFASWPAFAQPNPLGGEFRVNTDTALDQADPQVAMSATGDFVVVWSDGAFSGAGLDGSSEGIIAQRYSSDGTPVGGEIVVNTDTLGAQNEPAVAMDDDGNFVVVWTDTASFGGDGDGSSNGLAGQRFDSNGTKVGGQFAVNAITAQQQTRANVSMHTDGSFIVAWGTFNQSGTSDADLFLRQFDSNGTPLASEFQVNTYTYGRQYRAEVDFDADGDFVVAWRSAMDDDEDYDIIARRYDSSGNALSGELQVNAYTTGEQRDVGLVVGDDGAFIATWTSSNQDGSSRAVVARRFDSAGSPLGGDFVVNTYTTSSQQRPDISMDAYGRFTISWASSGQDGDGRGVFAQQFDSAGTPVGDEFQVNTYTTADQGYGFRGPDIAMDTDGNFVVVWSDDGGFNSEGQDGQGSGVYAQRYEGAPVPDLTLVGHWPLNEGSGTTTADSSNNGLDGSLENGTGWTAGQQSSGGLFDGIDDFIAVADSGASSPIDVTDALTIALWVRPDEVDGSTQVLVSKDDAYELEFGKLGAGKWDLRLLNKVVATAPTPVEQGVWQHLAVTWDGTTVSFYYNGLLDGTGNFTETLVPNDNALGFGARPAPFLGNGSVFQLAGALDEIYVYNRALDATEIADLVLAELTDIFPPVASNLAPGTSLPAGTLSADLSLDTDEDATCRYGTTPGITFDAMANAFTTTGGSSHSSSVAVADGQTYAFYVRCRDALGNTNDEDQVIVFGVGDSDLNANRITSWAFDEGNGCVAVDSVNSLDGTLGPNCPANAPQWSIGHAGAAALTFDDQDDVVTIASDPLFATPAEVTLSVWIRHMGNTGYRSIIDVRDGGSDGYDLYIQPSSKAFMRVNNKTLTGQSVIADGTWHHVVGTYDGNQLRLYVDGVLDASSNVGALSINVSADVQIGRHFQVLNNTLGGELSQVQIWDRALSNVETLDLYLLTR